MIDQTPPAAPVITAITEDTGVSNSDGITNDPTLILSGTAEANAVVEITRVGVGVIGTATANGSGGWTFDFAETTLPQGPHNFTATATDTAGNVSPISGTFQVVIDHTAPLAPVIAAINMDTGRSSSDGITSDPTLVLSGTAEANAVVELSRGVAIIGTATADGTGAWSFNYAGTTLPQGAHAFTATATDTAGNVSPISAAFNVVVDQTAPAAPVIAAIAEDTGASNSDEITNDPTLILSGTAEANAIVQVFLSGVGSIGTTTADGTGAWAFDYTGTSLGAGAHSFTATATDVAGNTSAASAAFNVVIDVTAPLAPVIAAINMDSGSSGSDGITNDNTLTLSGTAEANSVVELSRNIVGVIGTVTADATGAWSFDYTTVLPEGPHSFTATATDRAGNTGASSLAFNVLVDQTPPAAPVITAITEDTGAINNDGVTSDPTLIFSGTAEAQAVVTLTRVGVGVIGTATADSNGNWSIDYTAVSLPDGTHHFTATATDIAGNPSAVSNVFDVTIEGASHGEYHAAGTSPTNADSVVFNLVFSEAVSNVDASDFRLAFTGNVTFSPTLEVNNAGDADDSTYTLTVSTIAGDGTLGLDIVSGTNIQDSAGNLLDLTPTADEVYVIDNTALWPRSFKKSWTIPASAKLMGSPAMTR